MLCIFLGAPLAAQVSHPLDPLTWQEHWTLLEVAPVLAGLPDRAASHSGIAAT